MAENESDHLLPADAWERVDSAAKVIGRRREDKALLREVGQYEGVDTPGNIDDDYQESTATDDD